MLIIDTHSHRMRNYIFSYSFDDRVKNVLKSRCLIPFLYVFCIKIFSVFFSGTIKSRYSTRYYDFNYKIIAITIKKIIRKNNYFDWFCLFCVF